MVSRLLEAMPQENIVYFGDTGRVPYGSRSRAIIERYAGQDIRFLLSRDVKLIIAACGTVSSVAPHVGERSGLPFIEVVSPAAKAAASATRNGKIGVIGTAATIASGAYKARIQALRPDFAVFQNACPLFVPLVESGWFAPDDTVVRLTAQRYLEPLKAQGIDTLILGCTHYPILTPVIRDIMGEDVALVDTGETTAQAAAAYLRENGMLAARREGADHFFVSDTADSFAHTAGILLGKSVDFDVSRVEIERF